MEQIELSILPSSNPQKRVKSLKERLFIRVLSLKKASLRAPKDRSERHPKYLTKNSRPSRSSARR